MDACQASSFECIHACRVLLEASSLACRLCLVVRAGCVVMCVGPTRCGRSVGLCVDLRVPQAVSFVMHSIMHVMHM